MTTPVYSINKLSVLAYANGFTLWHYKDDSGDGYPNAFFKEDSMLRVGDIVLTSAGIYWVREQPDA